MTPEELKDAVSRLPSNPGVYRYYDEKGDIIYIGKAKNLKKRVGSYFSKNHESFRTTTMVARICNIEFTIVDTEIDALLLENVLIKKYQPRFNVMLKDDKTYPYLRITAERFPRISITRKPVKDGSEYFGPYASGRMMHTILELVNALYPTRTCNLNLQPESIAAGKFRICLEYQIGNCKGPCEGYQTEEEYQQSIQQIRNILRGNIFEVKTHLKQLMQQAAERLQFEDAAQYKKRLEILENYQSRSTIVSQTITDIDVFSITGDDKTSYVNYMKVANGMIIQTQNFEYRKKLGEGPAEILELAIAEVREKALNKSREILVPFEMELEIEKTKITVPKSGDKRKLLDLSLKNAELYRRDKTEQYEKLNPELRVDRLLTQMMKDLRLKELPRHIECFDNSNIQGTSPVSACVVFKDGKPSKKDYRHFNVKTVVGANDFATMYEVVTRRYKRLIEENQPLPQLVVIDGGKGQLGMAVQALQDLGIYGKMALIGIAKRLEEIFYPGDNLPLYLDKKSETLRIIQQLRDEAHRFGITHHRNRRDSSTLRSELLNIEGVGEKTMQLLLRELRSVKRIREASTEQLVALVGEKKTKLIRAYFEQEAADGNA